MDALSHIGTQLGVDQTFYYLFGLIFALHALLSAAYTRPFQRLLENRKEKTEGTRKEAVELVQSAEEKFTQYKARLKDINDKSRELIRENQETAKKEEAKILGDASVAAKVSLQNAQKELDVQRKATIDALSSEISGIADEIATKVMGRPAGTR